MEEDWDNLIILDACRYDQFERINMIPGTLEPRTSLGSGTPEFLAKTFASSTFKDTVIVTANPQYRTERFDFDDTFHNIIDVWRSSWNDEYGTVLPGPMADAVMKACREYPNKRLIAHFMQPHYPFIGDSAEEIGVHAGFTKTYHGAQGQQCTTDSRTVWELLQNNELSEEVVWRAYDENLEIALNHVEALLEEFEERTVISSDHGNLFGERPLPMVGPMYGHPTNIYHDAVRKVPWLVVEGDRRKRIKSGTREATETAAGESELVSERLADLGYAES